MTTENNQKSSGMTPHRLEALSDAIFAFAMTLLVLSINLPVSNEHLDISKYFINQYENFFNFALSFLLLAFFWLNYSQQYNHIKKTTAATIWINIILLLFIVLVPFSTSLMTDFSDNVLAEIFFDLNMFIISCLFSLNWWYCLKKGIVAAENKTHVHFVTSRLFLLPSVPLLALILAFIIPDYSTLVYLLIPIFTFLPQLKTKRH